MMAEEQAWQRLREDGVLPQDACARALEEGVNVFTRIRMLRSVYGLSFEEAKALDVEVAHPGTADALEQEANAALAADLLLVIPSEDADSLEHYPPYVVHALLECAPPTVEAPDVVFEGIRRNGALRAGYAFCRRLPFSVDNNGRTERAPADMTFVVYCDHEGQVFDWDWVEARPGTSEPVDSESRFGKRAASPPRALLILQHSIAPGRFDPHCASYSQVGDCAFAYISSSPSFAKRVNDDLTLFLSLDDPHDLTGVKVKNIERNLRAAGGDGLSVRDVQSSGPLRQRRGVAIRLEIILEMSRLRQQLRRDLGEPVNLDDDSQYERLKQRFAAADVVPKVFVPEAYVLDALPRLEARR